VVAEGVETERELAELKAANCDEAQGYLLGRPGPLEALGVLTGRRLGPGPTRDG